MATLQATGIADLVATTINELGDLKFTDIMSDLRRHVALNQLLKKNRVNFDAGPAIQWDLATDNNASARFVGLYATDVVNVPNVMIQGTIPWRHITWNWAIERREVAMNRSPRRIVDLTKVRRITAFAAATEKFEKALWRLPAATNTTEPYGIPYYIVKSNTEGFSGTVPSGYTVVAAINPTTYPRWANWTAQYTAISKDSLLAKLDKACEYTSFEPVVDGIPTFDTGTDMGIYTNYTGRKGCKDLLEAQNDDLGSDLDSQDGSVLFRRIKIQSVPALDDDTTNPFYGIQWGEFKTVGLRGEWMNETMLPIQPGQHTVSSTHTDCSFNWLTRNRRRHFVVATDTTMPA